MNDRSCGECRKLRTDECRRPDQCVLGGYKYYARVRNWRNCEECGARLKTIRSDQITENLSEIDVVCPECGLTAIIRREYIRRG